MTIGERIEWVLAKKGKKKIDLARDLGISNASVSTMCSGKTHPSGQTISMICQMYEVNKEWLLNETGEPFVVKTRGDEIAAIVNAAMARDPVEVRESLIAHIQKLTDAEIILLAQILDKR